MVRFEKDKMVIELPATMWSVEDWLELHGALCGLMSNVTPDNMRNDFYLVCHFLQELMPDFDTAKKMES